MGGVEKVKLKRISVLKSAVFLGIFGVFLGIVIAIVLWIVIFALSPLLHYLIDLTTQQDFYYFNFLWFPVGFGIAGFILGFIFTPIVNLILKLIKGLDMEFEEVDVEMMNLNNNIRNV